MLAEYAPGHKYDSAITCYMDAQVMGVSGYDDMVTHPYDIVSEGAALIGKRVLYWDEQGFVKSIRYKTETEARQAYKNVEQQYYKIVDQWQRECMHKNHDENSQCSVCEAEVFGPLQGVLATVYGYPGVAWRIDTHCESTNLVTCHMIGDDRAFRFEADGVTQISDEEYCSECGQIGCGWGH